VDVLGTGRSPKHWMQIRNVMEGKCFLNRNIRRVECIAIPM